DITLSTPVNLTIADGDGVGTILDNDDPMLDTGDGVEVDEANLLEGTDPDAPSLTKSGEFTYAAVSPVTLMIGGANQALAAVAQGGTVDGEHGTLTLGASSLPDVDGVVTVAYSYELTSNEDHAGEDGLDIFQVTFIDGSGVQLAPPQDMEVSIIDDVPDDFTPTTAIVSKTVDSLGGIALNFLDGSAVDGDRGVGADGAGTVLALASLGGTQVTAAGGQELKYNGETLTWEISAGGTVIKAITDNSNIEAIVITLDGAGDHYDLSIDDDFNFSIGNDINTFTAEDPVNGGNADNFYIINVGGEDIDVRVTTNNGGTVNTDSSDFGANSQWLNSTESLTFDFFTNIDPLLNGSSNTDIVGDPDGEVNSFQFRIDQGNDDAYDNVTATAFLNGSPVDVDINVVSGLAGVPGDGTVFEVTGVSNFDSLILLASGDANGKNLSITPLGFTEFSPSDIVMKVDLEGFDSDDTNDESAGSIIFGIDQDEVAGVDLDYVEAAPAAAFQAFSQPVVAEASSEPESNLIDASSEALIGTVADDVFVWDLADAGAAGTPDSDVVSDFGDSGNDALDLSDLLVDAGSDLTSYLSVTEESGSTVIKVSTGGDVGDATQVDQVITLDGVGFADLGLDVNDGMTTIIQDMVNAGKLITD
ncbi:MAG: type I secretion C-terminal target domain-containing protein, partial [Halioglobus sp.]